MSKRSTTLIGAAVALALLKQTAPVQAQSTGSSEIEEVVVTGIRASLRESMETKREAVGVVDALTAEDVGKFPDKNLAEALQRVPGIVINREFGEGERINLRGTGSNLTRTLLNGHALATADWFILDQLNSTRSFNYLMLPAEVIGKVTVAKSPQADFEEGGIGGTIDVATRNPLDMKPMSTYLSAQGAYTELADEFDPQVSGLFSWRNDDSTLGVMVSALYQERNIRRDGVEVLGYENVQVAGDTVLFPSMIGSALFKQERIRSGGNFGVQFRPSEAIDINVTGLYSRFEADNSNQNFIAWGTRALSGAAGVPGCPPGGTLTNPVIQDGTVVAGRVSSSIGGTCDFGAVYDAIKRFATAETRNIDFDMNFRPNDSLTLHMKVGYTDAEGNTDAQPFVEFGAPGVFEYDLRGKAPRFSFVPNADGEVVDPNDPDDVSLIFSSLHQILNDDEETYVYADALQEVEWGPVRSVKVGAKHTDHQRDLVFNATTYGGFHVPLNGLSGDVFAGGSTPGDFLDGVGGGLFDRYWSPDFNTVEDRLFANLRNTQRFFYPAQSFAVGEKAWAGYVMANMEGDKWRGNVGVRYVRTEQTSEGAQLREDGAIANPFGRYNALKIERTYDDVLPSLNVAFDLTNELVLRFAAAKVMARPDFTDVAPRSSLNIGALTGSSGNPDLDPYRANQADISLEWYRDNDSIIAAAVYYKDIKSFITDRPVTQLVTIQTGTPSAACTPTGQTDLYNCPFTINQRSNGGGGKIQGLELSVTQPIWGNFGINANYTYSDAEADSGDPIPGNSEDTFNLAAYYENQRMSARLSYTYRSEFFVTFDRSTQLNQKALESVDASLVVNVLDNVALTLDAINLTEEEIEQYATIETRPRAIYDNGRVFYAGVRLKF
ncbi:MAG TPA: TonB-dependent receptor [Steroidobacter sp.]|uniref:TonB-dependent receptor n=1 Tax=Steroidobacter sp. TaxID=1978227 RepID=UPI002EDB082E